MNILGNTLQKKLQAAALIVRGSTQQSKFHIQVTASAVPAGNSDDLLFAMIPDIDLLDATLAEAAQPTTSVRSSHPRRKEKEIRARESELRRTEWD